MADVAELRDVIWLDTLARATARHVPIRVTRKEAVRRSPDGTYSAHLVPLAAAGLLIVVGAGLAMYQFWHYAAVKGAFLEDWRRERVYEAIRGVKPDDVQQLIILNQRRMDQYHQMTLTQASVDWLRSARACPGISPPPSCARHESRSQLNYYFRQPLTTSYLLTAERLTHKLNNVETAQQASLTKLVELIAGHAFDVPPNPGGGLDGRGAPKGTPTPSGDHLA